MYSWRNLTTLLHIALKSDNPICCDSRSRIRVLASLWFIYRQLKFKADWFYKKVFITLRIPMYIYNVIKRILMSFSCIAFPIYWCWIFSAFATLERAIRMRGSLTRVGTEKTRQDSYLRMLGTDPVVLDRGRVATLIYGSIKFSLLSRTFIQYLSVNYFIKKTLYLLYARKFTLSFFHIILISLTMDVEAREFEKSDNIR